MKLQTGTRIIVTGAAGTVEAEVLDVSTPVTIPQIAGAPPVRLVARVLQELQIDQIALIGHMYGGEFAMFFALHNEARGWLDLHRQHLTIREIPRGTL